MTTSSPWQQTPRPSKAAPSAKDKLKGRKGKGLEREDAGAAGTEQVGASVPADGPIVAFRPSDGVFLRAAHLDQITDYARALGAALGRAGGSGVVHGFRVSLNSDDGVLVVGPGLAINREGEPLQSTEPATLPLSGTHLPVTSADGFYVLEVLPDPRPFGSEPTYGAVCADPCSGKDAAVMPWTMEGVAVRLRADDMPGLSGVDPVRQRNWLASQYFERERSTADPWLVPGLSPNRVPGLESRSWDEPRGAALGRAVPLAVVVRIGDDWVLDVWIARRDLGVPPGIGSWRDRLAMRPWSVFMAQILQFQDQVTETTVASIVVKKADVVDERARLTEAFLQSASEGSLGRRKDVQAFEDAYRKAGQSYVLLRGGRDLAQLGFEELPPAGYLPFEQDDKSSRAALAGLLAGVDVRFCRARADHIVTAVATAQHLDRIPLSGEYGRPQVDILVPTEPADLAPLRTDAYGWIAFVRRSERHCLDLGPEPQVPDRVLVLLAPSYSDDLMQLLRRGDVPKEAKRITTVEYAPGEAELPEGTERPDLDDNAVYHVIAMADSADREELMTKRAEIVRGAWSLQGQAMSAGVVEGAESTFVLAPIRPR